MKWNNLFLSWSDYDSVVLTFNEHVNHQFLYGVYDCSKPFPIGEEKLLIRHHSFTNNNNSKPLILQNTLCYNIPPTYPRTGKSSFVISWVTPSPKKKKRNLNQHPMD